MIASISTAPADRSLVRLMASSYAGDTLSASASIEELIASAANTMPIHRQMAIHSIQDNPVRKPAASTHTVMKQCIQALCSLRMSR